ncbi:MAG: hypothetical protein ACXVI9_07785, partial [Mucilaginibacter sp.]
AVYWKNGTVTNLDYDSGSDARSIFVKDNDVYITGTINTPLGTYALYWKNGKAVTLGPGDVTLVFGNSIYVDGTDVYVAGTAYRAPVAGAATYWKNGEATTLGHFGRYSEADFITVHNGETYVLGYRDSVTNDVPIYWKNNAQVATPNIYPDYSAFSAIAFDKASTLYFLRQTGSFSYYDKNGKSTRLAGNGDAGSFAYAIALSQY